MYFASHNFKVKNTITNNMVVVKTFTLYREQAYEITADPSYDDYDNYTDDGGSSGEGSGGEGSGGES